MVGHRLTHLFSKYKNNFISPLILTFKVVKICKTGEKKDPLSASFNQLQDTAFTSFFFPSFSNNIKYVILLLSTTYRHFARDAFLHLTKDNHNNL